jgi:hypothetical protein
MKERLGIVLAWAGILYACLQIYSYTTGYSGLDTVLGIGYRGYAYNLEGPVLLFGPLIGIVAKYILTGRMTLLPWR